MAVAKINKIKAIDVPPLVCHTFVLTILIFVVSFIAWRGNPYVAAVGTVLFVGVAFRNKWALSIARVLFGLAAAFGLIGFFNPLMLRDFAKNGDWTNVLPIAAALFIVYESIFLTAFLFCGKLLRQLKAPK